MDLNQTRSFQREEKSIHQLPEAHMAIALQPRFPIPDRSNQPVRAEKDEDGVLDIGWCDGVLSDGRPFRAEMWAQDQVSCLTIFFSTIEIEDFDDNAMQAFVENERLVSFKGERQYCTSAKWLDDAGIELWSVNIVVGDDENTFTDQSIPIFPYSKQGGPNTMFNPIAIKLKKEPFKPSGP
jgi:hypothetical protein